MANLIGMLMSTHSKNLAWEFYVLMDTYNHRGQAEDKASSKRKILQKWANFQWKCQFFAKI